jgi:membrane glycosyltransferase
VLQWGARIGLAAAVLAFALYVSGVLPGRVPLEELPALWSLPLTLGFLVAIPFAVWSAEPALGAASVRSGLYAIPEEINTPAIVAKLRAREAGL